MRTKYTDPDFRRNPKTALFCYQCQKDLKPESEYRLVYVVDGMSALHPDDIAAHVKGKNDLGLLPIGPDCARRLGLEWSVPGPLQRECQDCGDVSLSCSHA